jgi:hypothetical protein
MRVSKCVFWPSATANSAAGFFPKYRSRQSEVREPSFVERSLPVPGRVRIHAAPAHAISKGRESMILFWRVRYLGSRDKRFKDRDLYLVTTTLPSAEKAGVELCHELHNFKPDRSMLKYRDLFVEKNYSVEKAARLADVDGYGGVSFRSDYFEDETGKEITHNQIADILSGNPTADATNGALKVFLHSMANPRSNRAIQHLLEELNAAAFTTQGPI